MRSERAAGWAFWIAAAAFVPFALHRARDGWFTVDDWVFLRPLGSLRPRELLEPYWGHWTTVPRVWESALFTVFGLHSYVPYQLGVVLLHVASVALVRTAMVRLDVEAWTATALAAFLLVFGPGAENIVIGFQASMTASLAFGLAQLVLADHDGGRRRRDALSVACGVLAVASTNVGPVLVVGTGLAVLLRRGWRSAALVTAPVGAAYAAWWLIAARGVEDPEPRQAGSLSTVLEQVRALLEDFVRDAGPGPTGTVLAAASLVGLGLVVVGLTRGERARLAVPAGLAVAAVLLLLSVGYTRGGRLEAGGADATPSRYLHLLAAFLLPIAALSISALASRRRWGGLVVLAAVAVCLPANVEGFTLAPRPERIASITVAAEVLGGYEHSTFPALPPTLEVDGRLVWPLRVSPGWLQAQHRAGRIPDPPAGTEDQRDQAFATLVLAPSGNVSAGGCEPLAAGEVELPLGARLVVQGPPGTTVAIEDVERDLRAEVDLGERAAAAVVVQAGPVPATVGPVPAGAQVLRCLPS